MALEIRNTMETGTIEAVQVMNCTYLLAQKMVDEGSAAAEVAALRGNLIHSANGRLTLGCLSCKSQVDIVDNSDIAVVSLPIDVCENI